MRSYGIVLPALAALAMLSTASVAAEFFIPQGHTYSPDNTPLPRLNSREDRINLQTDLLQSEIDQSQRKEKQFDSELNRFLYSQTLGGLDTKRLDY